MKSTPSFVIVTTLLALATACHPTKSAAVRGDDSEQLYLHRWELTALRDKPVYKTERVQPYLVFEPGEPGQLSGSLGCNQLAGTFTLTAGDSIFLSPVITTKMACPDQALEYAFSGILKSVDRWKLADEVLLLSKGEKPAATFKAASRR